jgi:hypothetical protein
MSPVRTRSSVAVCVLLLAGGLSASPTCVLKGRVRDARTGDPLVGASVVVNGTESGNATDLNGDYVIVGLPATTGTATAAYAGYGDKSASFTTTAACTTHLDFGLQYPLEQPTTVSSPSRLAGPRPVPLPLPAWSDSRFSKGGGCIVAEMSLLAIRQVDDSVLIQTIGPRMADMPNWNGPSIKEGIIPIDSFRTFWDSLSRLGFWHLNDRYEALASRTGEEGGSISVGFETRGQRETKKTVSFFAPGSCSLEFRLVYSLFGSMTRFAKSPPDWKMLVGYEAKEPIEGLKSLYHAEALQAIAVDRDSQDLDTLMSMLKSRDDFATAAVRGLGGIGNGRAAPALEEFLAGLDSAPASWDRDYLIIDVCRALFNVNGKQRSPAITHFLSASYRAEIVYKISEMLASAGDYSGVPAVVEILRGPTRGEVTWAAEALKEIGYGSQMAISALLEVAQKEMRADQPSDRVMVHTTLALAKLTGREFTYHPEDSLSVKRSNMAEWLKWWKANARRYPIGEGGPEQGYGYIHVNSNPSGATIILDSTDAGNTTPFLLLRVSAGSHRLRLTKETYADWSSSVSVKRGRATSVRASLSQALGSLHVRSIPSGAAISLDGMNTGTTTPRTFTKVAAGRRSLGLAKAGHLEWDTAVTVTHKLTTTAEAELKTLPESLWITHAGVPGPFGVVTEGPERAVRFYARYGFGYPLHIAKVSTVFLHHRWDVWPDSSFRFRIYGGDGQTLLYESPVLEAVPGVPGPPVLHELSNPVLIDSGAFYVSVAPVGPLGQPASIEVSEYRGGRNPLGMPDEPSNKRNFTGSPGHWFPFDRGEIYIDVLLRR